MSCKYKSLFRPSESLTKYEPGLTGVWMCRMFRLATPDTGTLNRADHKPGTFAIPGQGPTAAITTHKAVVNPHT